MMPYLTATKTEPPRTMPCSSYDDPRLTALYDPLNPDSTDRDFYVALAGDEPRTVLDMGCGTGRLACALAARGHRATGAEPAAAMLDIARRRPGGDAVIWIESGAAELSVETRFDLIIMTGHVFQVFLDDAEVAAVLGNLRRHLAPGGRVAFETRNQAAQDWDTWGPEQTLRSIEVPGVGMVDYHCDIAALDGQFLTFESYFHFAADDIVVAPHSLRFLTQDGLAGFLAAAGYTDVTWYGDWDRSATGPTKPEIIVIAG